VKRVAAKAPWVADWAYSRATRIGGLIEVGGTTAGKPDGTIEGPGDLYAQTKYALSVVLAAVEELGGRKEDILRTRVFIHDIDDWRAAGRAHAEMFGEHLPTSSCIGGLAFLHPDLLVEIEATAYVPNSE
jgi:enamine deaminase RidA (YjgF/YER057c/UK114 family)